METNENVSSIESMRFFLMVSIWWTVIHFTGHLTLLTFFAAIMAYPISAGMDTFLREKEPPVHISTKIRGVFMMLICGLVWFLIPVAIAIWVFHATASYITEAMATFVIVVLGSFLIRISAFDLIFDLDDAITLSWLCQAEEKPNLSMDMAFFGSIMMASVVASVSVDAFHFRNQSVWVVTFLIYMFTFAYLGSLEEWERPKPRCRRC